MDVQMSDHRIGNPPDTVRKSDGWIEWKTITIVGWETRTVEPKNEGA